jgi:hypothetical protein
MAACQGADAWALNGSDDAPRLLTVNAPLILRKPALLPWQPCRGVAFGRARPGTAGADARRDQGVRWPSSRRNGPPEPRRARQRGRCRVLGINGRTGAPRHAQPDSRSAHHPDRRVRSRRFRSVHRCMRSMASSNRSNRASMGSKGRPAAEKLAATYPAPRSELEPARRE